jgi:hypothetical protein
MNELADSIWTLAFGSLILWMGERGSSIEPMQSSDW